MFRFDIGKKAGAGEASILVYQIGDDFSLVATAKDDGDAEIFLNREELAELQRRLSEVVT